MRSLSFDDFKKWMKDHDEEHNIEPSQIIENRLIGSKVQSKLSERRLIAKIIPEHDNLLEKLAEEFSENGGEIIAINENRFAIETESGTFELHKCYIKRD